MNKDTEKAETNGLWGDEEAELQESMRKRVDERISKLPKEKKRLVYGVLVAAVVVLFVGLISWGTVIAMGQTSQSDQGKAALDTPDNSRQDSTALQDQELAKHYVDADYLDFLSEESRFKFMGEFSAYLTGEGYDAKETVKVWSSVERSDTKYTFYVSTSSDGRFYRVVFDAQTKAFAFERSAAPTDIPELQNGGEAAAKAAAEQAEAAKQSAETPITNQSPPVTPAAPISTCKLTDTAELSTILPEKALSMLPDTVSDFMASKGYEVTPGNCMVNLSSATVKNSNPYFEISCSTSSGEVIVISCEWNASASQFGMGIIG